MGSAHSDNSFVTDDREESPIRRAKRCRPVDSTDDPGAKRRRCRNDDEIVHTCDDDREESISAVRLKRSHPDDSTDDPGAKRLRFVDERVASRNTSPSRLLRLPTEIFMLICSYLDTATLRNICVAYEGAARLLEGPDGVCSVAARREKLFWSVRNEGTKNATAPPAFTSMSKVVEHENRGELEKEWTRSEDLLAKEERSFQVDARLTRADGYLGLVRVSGNKICWKNLESSTTVASLMLSNGNNIKNHLTGKCLTVKDRATLICRNNGDVELWTLTNSSFVQNAHFVASNENTFWSCISNYVDGNLFAIGAAFRGSVNLFDRRAGPNPIVKYKVKKSLGIVDLGMNSNNIFTLSDTWLDIYDVRFNKISKYVSGRYWWDRRSRIELRHDWICVNGCDSLHVLNPMDGYETMKNYGVVCPSKTTSLRLTRDYLVLGHCDGTANLYTPTDPPTLLATLPSENIGLIARVDCLDDTVSVAASHGIAIWRREKSTI